MANQQAPQKVRTPTTPPTGWRRFWWRYSPNFELPISTVISVSLHVFVILLFALGLTAFAKRNHRPPGVDCVAVVDGDGDGAAPGFGDDGRPSGAGAGVGGDSGQALETSASAANDMPLPTAPAAQLETEVQADAPTEADFSDVGRGVTASSVTQNAQDAARRLAQGLNRAGRGTGTSGGDGTGSGTGGDGSGGGGQGGGGGNAAQGRSARQARWVLHFSTRSAADYVEQIKGLGATIAFPGDAGTYICMDLSSSPPGKSIRKEGDITEMFWMDSDPASVRRVADHLGMTATAGYFVTFLPQRLESRLFELELAYRNLREDQIKSTDFEVVRSGGGYDVQVVSQQSR